MDVSIRVLTGLKGDGDMRSEKVNVGGNVEFEPTRGRGD